MKKGLFVLFCIGLLLRFETQAADIQLAGAITTPILPTTRVVIAEDRDATDAFRPRSEKVQAMVDSGIEKLTGKTNLVDAWRTFVATQDVVGIKVLSGPGRNSGTRPAVVEAVIEGLIAAGVPPQQIVIWDKHLADLRPSGFIELAQRHNVKVAGSADSGYDEKTFYENAILGTLVWGDLEFGNKDANSGRKSYVSKLLTGQLTKIINIAPLLNHNVAGVNGCLCSLALGSVDNTMRFELQADRLARAVPEIYALSALNDHAVLNIVDALIGQYEGEQVSLLHYSSALNQIWFSKDPVALDVLAIQELDQERQLSNMPPSRKNPELYQNAALMELGVGDVRKIRVEKVK